MRFLPVNLNALLVELDDLPQTLALLQSLRAQPVPGVTELIPAARTLMVTFHPGLTDARTLAGDIGGRDTSGHVRRDAALVRIPVHYDGEDLQQVADLLGLSPQAVIDRHSGSAYFVAFTGFAPGFAYLTGGHPDLDVPRLKTPRTRVPAGSVALAGTFSAVYPQASPGGWQLLGRTPAAMWDLQRRNPALLQPGDQVRFVDAATLSPDALAQLLAQLAGELVAADAAQAGGDAAACLEILSPGLQALFQDAGRHGMAGMGISPSGAVDRAALDAANALAGNAPGTPCLEVAQGGFQAVCRGDAVAALTGADLPVTVTRPDGVVQQVSRYAPFALADGDRLALGAVRAGVRAYLAVRGGFDVTPVLGSCATDTLALVGPAPVAAGDRLPILPVRRGGIVGWPLPAPQDLPRADQTVVLDIVPGPRDDWFTPEAWQRLVQQPWRVTAQSNRVGMRLSGVQALDRARHDELPSEGVCTGAIQVPASGQPVLFLADHPLTGGYPVIAAVATHHLDLAGQIPVGAWVRFHPIAGPR